MRSAIDAERVNIGAGSGIRTHAARKGHRLSRPAPLDPHMRVNPLGPRDAVDKLRDPGAKTRLQTKKALALNSPNKRLLAPKV